MHRAPQGRADKRAHFRSSPPWIAVLLATGGCLASDSVDVPQLAWIDQQMLQSGAESDDAARPQALGTDSPRAQQLPGFDVTITKNGPDINLVWADQGTSSTYEVWRSTTPYFEPGDPTSTMLDMTPASTFVDVGANFSDDEVYYQIRAITADGTSTTSTTVGKLVYDVYPGYTKMGICLISEVDTSAELVDDMFSQVISTHVFDAVTQAWTWAWAYEPGPGLSFGVGQVVSVNHNEPVNPPRYVMVGHVPADGDVAVTLSPGDNLVTLMPLSFGDTSASALMTMIPEATRIGLWDDDSQTTAWYPDDGDFVIPTCSHVHVEVDAPTTWPPPVSDAQCGNGAVEAGEACDDANTIDDDGCDSDCQPSAVVQVESIYGRTCVVTRVGGLKCWGGGQYGGPANIGYGVVEMLGDDETPADVGTMDVGGSVVQISGGSGLMAGPHVCAVLDTGEARCWGQIGSNNLGGTGVPADLPPVDVGANAVLSGSGRNRAFFITEDGAGRGFGASGWGSIGYPGYSFGSVPSPATVGDLPLDVSPVLIDSGQVHTCALMESGTVRCWGAGNGGRLGNGSNSDVTDASLAVDIDFGPGTVGQATGVSTDWNHSCAVVNGGAYCWGVSGPFLGYAGLPQSSLGYGNPAALGPVDLGSATVVQVDAGFDVTCALTSAGEVYCWGYNGNGRLGYGHTNTVGDNESPASAGPVDLGGTAVQISVAEHICALLDTGAVRCWGNNSSGQLGYGVPGHVGDDETPAMMGDVPVF